MASITDDLRRFLGITPDQWQQESLALGEKVMDSAVWDSVPLYNHASDCSFRDHQLVRFRCMIQDMLDPEYYFKTYEVRDKRTGEQTTKSGMYRDINEDWLNTVIVEDSKLSERSDRSTFYCISIPGVTPWVIEMEGKNSQLLAHQSVGMESNEKVVGCNGVKRTVDEMQGLSGERAAELGGDDLVAVEDPDGSLRQAKRERKLQSSSANPSIQHEGSGLIDLNHPLGDANAKACYVKFYDCDTENFMLNDMIEVLGFLSTDPYMSALEADDGLNGSVAPETSLPPSLVPRLHAVVIKKIKHVNPLVEATDKDTILSDAATTFDELLRLFTQIMMGDEICAEYLIYSLVASVYVRYNEGGLGQLPLNIHNVPLVPGFLDNLHSILTMLVEKCHRIEMKVTDLNIKQMIPCKDYTTNILKTGQLQLSANTVIFIDETSLEEGQLVNRGCLNIAALKEICEKQTIKYDFQYFPLEYQTNLSIIVLSAGRSLLPCTVSIKMSPCPESVTNMEAIFQAAKFHSLKETMLSTFRKYLTVVRHSVYDISDELQDTLQQDFVQLRKDDPKFVVQDFHRLLVIARLASLCRGEGILTVKTWNSIVELEQKRRQRAL